MITIECESYTVHHHWPDFIRTQDCRDRFRATLAELTKTRSLKPDMLAALGLSLKDYRRIKLTHGPAKEREMSRLIGALEHLQNQRDGIGY